MLKNQYHQHIFLRTWYYGSPGCALMHYRKAETLGLINFECIQDDELSRYWNERISNPQTKESPHIVELMEQAAARLKEYEKTYLAAMESSLAYDRERDKELRQSDNEFRWKRQMDEEMQQRLKELPPRFHAAIYDEYAEKRKRFLERKGKK